ncbi:endonuclease/exonuclease/phosphatase family protein [Carboxylicivirga marina]|uniref:Endonuclease/exonuclease/phosphatase family protein n=1 Tax=Carboxylicivirga marina TaxID=2800988 RepID=A0ABS1HPA1_9BACT|nr:endonuclease/exonuclease/phosphatase family protein [Carboxylicivirga marina]MBK3519505.1 endonuclease/exonuclease/phosphatase family protein [Carboxylicivirga marina]
MKIRGLLLLCTLTLGGVLYYCSNGDRNIKVMSFNIRYDNPQDGVNAWSNRKAMVFSFLDEQKPDIIGFQEVLKSQLEQLNDHLGDYAYVGAGRDDGKESGEFVPVFYRHDKFELLASSHFWLSETPEVIGSKSWGAVLPRIVTWLQLKDKENGYIFYVFNTHFSHVSAFARNESTILILNKIKTIAGEAPVVLTGDFNAQPSERMYSTMVDNWKTHLQLWDSRHLPLEQSNLSFQTFNGFNKEMPEVVIDHIFVNGFFDVHRFSTHQITKDDVFISDHYPVMSELTFRLNRRRGSGALKKLMQSTNIPLIQYEQLCFYDSTFVEITPQGQRADIYYTINGEQPDSNAIKYRKTITIKESSTVLAKAYSKGMYPSSTASLQLIKKTKTNARLKEVIPEADEQYYSPGYKALFDNKQGNSNDLKDGSWYGFYGTDNDFLFDLKKSTQLNELFISALSRPSQWIVSPSKIEVLTSLDGINYKSIAIKHIQASFDESTNKNLLFYLPLNARGRFVKVSVYNGGLLPPSHSGNGNPSWFFIDEMVLQ